MRSSNMRNCSSVISLSPQVRAVASRPRREKARSSATARETGAADSGGRSCATTGRRGPTLRTERRWQRRGRSTVQPSRLLELLGERLVCGGVAVLVLRLQLAALGADVLLLHVARLPLHRIAAHLVAIG